MFMLLVVEGTAGVEKVKARLPCFLVVVQIVLSISLRPSIHFREQLTHMLTINGCGQL